MTNEILECIKSRRSIKKYKSTPVPEEALAAILEAGTYAPTGKNMQTPVILAVTDKAMRDRLSRLYADILGTAADPFYGAPCVLVVLADRSVLPTTYINDGSLVMGNMLLAAHSLGLGGCWVHRAKEMFECEEGKAILRELGIEGDLVGIGNCIIGYADGEYPTTRPRKENYVYRVK